ncbi:glycosyltransferase [Mangrovimonas xylaniphaga]|uniref:glycosyltransferase n=1 Tax=Mangrovimonas xylaniphaga TaxID=1645915 RepID=UPI0006B4073E|nr:glycosyltransferase [Mangrovimonas xylaniphaga]
MNIIIYNPNSFGGNYEYAHEIALEFSKRHTVDCKLVLPKNSKSNFGGAKFLLLPDILPIRVTLFRKLYFVFRSFLNPMIFWVYLLMHSKSKVIFNDFDQTTSIFWSPFYRLLKRKHSFAVILHDPDRDAYFSKVKWSTVSMGKVMSVMHLAFYHEMLPNKVYYQNKAIVFTSIPHGIYEQAYHIDLHLQTQLQALKGDNKLVGVLGNIRKEKNYEDAICALAQCEYIQLVIAGKVSNSEVDLNVFKTLATSLGVADRIYWINKYLTNDELNTVISELDIILLNYASSFTSQSGILNLIAPYSPNVIVSQTSSALSKLCERFRLGHMIQADNREALIQAFTKIDENFANNHHKSWKRYRAYASWEHNVSLILSKFAES